METIEDFLNYLFYKYYQFQVRVGNGDVAPVSTTLIISFTVILYYFSIFFLSILFIPKGMLNMEYFKYISVLVCVCSITFFYFLFLHKRVYKKIIKRNHLAEKNSLGAILFVLLAFILFNLGWILKLLQNQDKL